MNIILSYFMDVTRNLASHPLAARTSTTPEGGLLRTCVQTGCAPISSLHGYYITFLQGWFVHHSRPYLPPMFAGWPSSSLFSSKVFPRRPNLCQVASLSPAPLHAKRATYAPEFIICRTSGTLEAIMAEKGFTDDPKCPPQCCDTLRSKII